MAPSAIVENLEVSEFTGAAPAVEILPLAGRIHRVPGAKIEVPVAVKDLFKSALIEKNRMTRGSKAADVVISVLLHVTILSAPILASLYYTNTLDLKQFTATFLVAPPPPPPPPPAAAPVVRVAPRRVFMNQGKLLTPRYIPKEIANIKEAPIPESGVDGAEGGVPGGVPGGQMGGVIGGVIGGILNNGPLAPLAKPKAPIRVGGRIKAPRAILQPPPLYPVIAKQARITGVVVIDAVLDERGNVVEMKVLSGPPLLYPAALGALKEWKYEPTYLNDQAISVQMIVNITFQLTENK